jgi:hypothetical protein
MALGYASPHSRRCFSIDIPQMTKIGVNDSILAGVHESRKAASVAARTIPEKPNWYFSSSFIHTSLSPR